MKKTLHIIAFAAVALAALTSCAKEQFNENAIPAGEKIQVSINGLIGELTPADATKATAGSVVRVKWVNGDKVYVYDGSDASIGTLTVTPDDNNASYALLSGTITASSASPAPTKLTLVYVKGAESAPAIAGGKILIDLSVQNQTEVPFVLYSSIDYATDALSKAKECINFEFATSVMTVNCTDLSTGAENAKIDITKAEIDGVSTACELAVTGSGVTFAGASKGTITRTAGFEQSDSRGAFRLALATDPTAPAARNILVHQGSKVSGSPFTSATLAAGKSYNTVYQMCEYIPTPPAGALSGEFTVADDGNGNVKKVHFSTGNLYYDGNNAPHFEANQYAIPSSWDATHVSHFTWSSTVEVAVGYGTNSGDNLFCDESHKVSVDGGEAIYYALSKDEWIYLFEHHSKKWASVNGVNGYVIAPDDFSGELSATYTDDAALATDNLVFLPAAGYRSGSGLNDVGDNGDYWSSTGDNNNNAWSVHFESSFFTDSGSDRGNYCCSVRLVTESGEYTPTEKVTGVSLNKTKTTIDVGDSEKLVAIVAPANATNKQVAWSSSDEAVATVDENGEVTGVAEGSAVITATTADGNFTAVCLVTVTPKPLPADALPGKFTVNSDGKTVHFSKGNLYCSRTSSSSNDWTWHFYDEQYQYNESYSQRDQYDALIAAESDTQIDLFTWGYNAEKSILPTGHNTDNVNRNSGNLALSEDWGYVFGGNSSPWRTLTKDEWDYLLGTSSVRSGKYRIDVTVCGKENCLVIAPDEWNLSANPLLEEYSTTSTMTWAQAEAAGLVCLPAVGRRIGNDGNELNNYGDICCYWSSSAKDGTNAWSLYSTDIAFTTDNERYSGYAVRLVSQ